MTYQICNIFPNLESENQLIGISLCSDYCRWNSQEHLLQKLPSESNLKLVRYGRNLSVRGAILNLLRYRHFNASGSELVLNRLF